MNLFQMHTQNDQKKACKKYKKELVNILGQYVKVQRRASELICSKPNLKAKKLNKYLDAMSVLEERADQLAKTYRLLFDDDNLEYKTLLRKAVKKHYPLGYKFVTARAKQHREANGDGLFEKDGMFYSNEIPADAPEEVKEIFRAIQAKVGSMPDGKKVKFGVMNMANPEETYGLNPAHFKNFGDFLKAVSKAKKKATAIEKGETTAEEVINEAIIHNVEAHQNGEDTSNKKPEKLN